MLNVERGVVVVVVVVVVFVVVVVVFVVVVVVVVCQGDLGKACAFRAVNRQLQLFIQAVEKAEAGTLPNLCQAK